MNYLLFSYIVCIQKSTNIRVQEFICFERLLLIAAARSRSHNSTRKSGVSLTVINRTVSSGFELFIVEIELEGKIEHEASVGIT